ncbi:MAG TPA: hypothetical protein VE011_02325 [Candidatus Dormibacteraeota bacterium]|nr:hypothetical protein [Candidatus Dormibacteraeota bacterium]
MAIDTTGIPAHLEHRITTRDGRTLAIAEWGDPNGIGLFALHGTPDVTDVGHLGDDARVESQMAWLAGRA